MLSHVNIVCFFSASATSTKFYSKQSCKLTEVDLLGILSMLIFYKLTGLVAMNNSHGIKRSLCSLLNASAGMETPWRRHLWLPEPHHQFAKKFCDAPLLVIDRSMRLTCLEGSKAPWVVCMCSCRVRCLGQFRSWWQRERVLHLAYPKASDEELYRHRHQYYDYDLLKNHCKLQGPWWQSARPSHLQYIWANSSNVSIVTSLQVIHAYVMYSAFNIYHTVASLRCHTICHRKH